METEKPTYEGFVKQSKSGQWSWELHVDGECREAGFGLETEGDAVESLFDEMSDKYEGFKFVLRKEAGQTSPDKPEPMAGKVPITINLSDDEAQALAQYLKRYIWTDVRKSAVNDEEAYLMRDAFNVIQRELSEAGYAPR